MKWLLSKCAYLIGVYLIASLGLFLAIKAIPGDPILLRFEKFVDPAKVEAERSRLGLDKPLHTQFLAYNQRFVTGNWGQSFATGRDVLDDVADFFPATLELSGFALLLGIAYGSFAALFATASDRPMAARIANFLGNLGLTIPIFWFGLGLLVVGSLWLGAFPSGGRSDLALIEPPVVSGFLLIDSLLAGDLAYFANALLHLFLPTVCLSIIPAANVSSVLYARLKEPEIVALRTALKARGIGFGRLVWRHLLRIGAGPTITIIGTSFGALLGGAFLTETVFSWPGVGRYLVGAILERDVYIVESVLLAVILLVVAVAAVSEAIAHVADPRNDGEEGSQ